MAELKPSQRLPDAWSRLRDATPARIGLGRVGSSLPTNALLAFDLAHARARDAVHAAFDGTVLALQIEESGFAPPILVTSQARDRMEYLLRPGLGRTLDEESGDLLREHASANPDCSLAIVIADGLSARAPERHAVPLLKEMRDRSGPGFENVTVVVANRGRVALGDAIGEVLGAETVVVLIGERPGLSSPDSLGAYFTWAPRVGCTDARRNCVSNIRPEGLPYVEAARRLAWLLGEARRLRLSGVGLKDDSDSGTLESLRAQPLRPESDQRSR